MRLHSDERGQTIILVALSLPLMLGFVGIATDVGALFKDKRDPQTLAGIAALLLTDRALRETLLEGQRRRFEILRRDGELERAG